MSLVRLLTAGKSLVGIQDLKSRYRSVDPRALPKFGSEKKINAEIARESGVRASVAKSRAEASKADVNVAADRNVRAPLAEKNIAPVADRNANAGTAEDKVPVKAARQDRSSGWVSQLGSKLSSLVSQRPKAARNAIPRLSAVPVQGELSLENIKVVRNDLSDTDLEIVTKKSAQEPEPKQPAIQEGPSQSERPPTWERATTMFSAVKS
jgi:hypothetical protein